MRARPTLSRPFVPALLLVAITLVGAPSPLVADDGAAVSAGTRATRFTPDDLTLLLGAEKGTLTMFGQEVGVLRGRTRIVVVEGEERLLVEERLRLRMRIFGSVTESDDLSRTWYSLERPGQMVRGESIVTEDGTTTRVIVERRGGTIHCERTVAGETENTTLEDLDTVEELIAVEEWALSSPPSGETRVESMIDWTDGGRVTTLEMTSLGRGERSLGEETLPVVRTRVVDDGMPATVETSLDGKRYWVEMDGGSTVIAVEPADPNEPLDLSLPEISEDEVPDATSLGKIACHVPLGDPDRLEELILVAEGVRPEVFVESPRQRVTVLGERSVRLELRAGHLATESVPLTPEERSRYLASTSRFRLEDPDLAEFAREIVGAAREPIAVGALISDWIYYELEYDAARNSDRSDHILDSLAGDCTEHAILFVALARVIDLPARAVTGLVWMEDEEYGHGFYRHAWAEFHDGTRWVSVDPTWGQVGVDAGHVRLDEPFDETTGDEMHAPGFAFELHRLRRSPVTE